METHSIIKPPESRFIKSGRVKLFPNEEIGKHVTDKREEILVVLKGTAALYKDDKKIVLKTGDTYFIEENVTHNVKNESDIELEYIYVVTLFD